MVTLELTNQMHLSILGRYHLRGQKTIFSSKNHILFPVYVLSKKCTKNKRFSLLKKHFFFDTPKSMTTFVEEYESDQNADGKEYGSKTTWDEAIMHVTGYSL